ncbi:MAG: FAD binding domain-containing protein [Planctomycetota bacterium]|nr:FAD binding domain-containing protein [Planctomycetota bacterium]
MLRLPAFRFLQPTTIDEAVAFLAEDPGNTRLVAGGTDLWPNMKRRHQGAGTVVSLRGIEELCGIEEADDGGLVIGATTTLDTITDDERVQQRYPALVTAVASISSPLLRNAGTIGGNLCLDTRCTYYNQNEEWRRSIDYCMKEEGEICWVAPSSPRCWAVSSGDSVPMLCALGAEISLTSKEGERSLPLADLFLDDGIEYLSKRPDEIVTRIQIPAPSGERAAFWKLRRRGSIDFGVLSVAVAGWCNGDTTDRIEIWLGSVGSTPVRCAESIAALTGKPLDAETIASAAALARKSAGANPLGNTDFVPQWRGKMIEKYVEAVLREIAGLPRQRMAPNHG